MHNDFINCKDVDFCKVHQICQVNSAEDMQNKMKMCDNDLNLDGMEVRKCGFEFDNVMKKMTLYHVPCYLIICNS